MADIQRREPDVFACGDTMLFCKHLFDFPASQGWFLQYNLITEAGQPAAEFVSAADGDDHKIDVPAFAAALDPVPKYILFGYAINNTANPVERHQIYRAELVLQANAGAGQAVDDETPFDEKMIAKLEAGLLRLAENELNETDIQRVRVLRIKRVEQRTELCFWQEKRNHRQRQELIRNGGPNRSRIQPIFQICG